MKSKLNRFVAGCAVAVAVGACAQETADVAESMDAPDVAEGALDIAVEGTTWDGWSQSPSGQMNGCYEVWTINNTFTRSYGDATRGGGVCLVGSTTTSCTGDASCISNARSLYGSQAYGYCYSGTCYYRSGAQSTHCKVGGNWSPGTISTSNVGGLWDRTLGCMTKAAGPSAACGSTNPADYMRTIATTAYDYACASP